MNEIRAAQEELSRTFGEAGQSFYAQSQAASAAPGAGPEAGPVGGETGGARPADDVVEADYEIVDEKK